MCECVVSFCNYPDNRQFVFMSLGGQQRLLHNLRYDVSTVTAVGVWMNFWTLCGRNGAPFRVDSERAPFIFVSSGVPKNNHTLHRSL